MDGADDIVGPTEGCRAGIGVGDLDDGILLGALDVDEKPVGFKHSPEFGVGCWHCLKFGFTVLQKAPGSQHWVLLLQGPP